MHPLRLQRRRPQRTGRLHAPPDRCRGLHPRPSTLCPSTRRFSPMCQDRGESVRSASNDASSAFLYNQEIVVVDLVSLQPRIIRHKTTVGKATSTRRDAFALVPMEEAQETLHFGDASPQESEAPCHDRPNDRLVQRHALFAADYCLVKRNDKCTPRKRKYNLRQSYELPSMKVGC